MEKSKRVFTRLFQTAEIARFDRKEYLAYEESLKNLRDWFSMEKTAEGRGIEIGDGQRQRKTALKMLKKGMDVELISDITELPIEEVITLKQGQLNGNR